MTNSYFSAINDIRIDMVMAAFSATLNHLQIPHDFELPISGISTIRIYPKYKKGTDAYDHEVDAIERLGFRKYVGDGDVYVLHNPSGVSSWDLNAQTAGSKSAVEILLKYGFDAEVYNNVRTEHETLSQKAQET